MRLIDADALPISVGWMEQGSKQEHCAFVFERDIKDAPTVDAVKVKHGHWIASDPRITGAYWVCSRCGFPSEAHGAFKLYKYCPNCGARMDKSTQSNDSNALNMLDALGKKVKE